MTRGIHDEDRVFGGHRIEFRKGQFLRTLLHSRIEITKRQPFAGLGCFGLLGNMIQHLFGGLVAGHADIIHEGIHDRPGHHMCVRVDKARQERFAVKVNHCGIGTSRRAHVVFGTNGEDAFATNGDGVCFRKLSVDCQYGAVYENCGSGALRRRFARGDRAKPCRQNTAF